MTALSKGVVCFLLSTFFLNSYAASPIQHSLRWLVENADDVTLLRIDKKGTVLVDSNTLMYTYSVSIQENLIGDDEIGTLCSTFNLEQGSSYLLFVSLNSFELMKVKTRLQQMRNTECRFGIVGGGDGIYQYEEAGGNRVLRAAYPMSIFSDRCAEKYGVIKKERNGSRTTTLDYVKLKTLLQHLPADCEK